MLRIPGYTLLKSGRWKTPAGATITEAQYQNHVARYQGYRDYRDFLRAQTTARYEYFADIETRNTNGASDPWALDSGFANQFGKARKQKFNPDADGAFAGLLEYLGLREEGDDWDVGETGEV